MIIDNLENFHKYIKLHNGFGKVEKFLDKIGGLNSGSYEIEGKNIYVNIDEYSTKNLSESKPEAHKKYIDIQIVLSGYEKIGYASINSGKSVIEYNEEKDIEFLDADCEYMKANPGKFFIFFPEDIHHPCISDGEKSNIKKAVFKIKI